MISPTELSEDAMQLPEKERADIAHQLLLSLELEGFDNDEVASAWHKEIEVRLDKTAKGSHQAHDWREALLEIRQDLPKDTKP